MSCNAVNSYLTKKHLKDLNRNPDRFAQKLKVSQLRNIIDKASDLYYNGNEKGSGMKDYSYDTLCFYLNKKDKASSKRREKIGAIPHQRIRCQLPYYMPSLNKVKVGNGLYNFIASGKYFSWSLKLDGVSGMVVYQDRKVQEVYLRGDGTNGGDISFVKDYIKQHCP